MNQTIVIVIYAVLLAPFYVVILSMANWLGKVYAMRLLFSSKKQSREETK